MCSGDETVIGNFESYYKKDSHDFKTIFKLNFVVSIELFGNYDQSFNKKDARIICVP